MLDNIPTGILLVVAAAIVPTASLAAQGTKPEPIPPSPSGSSFRSPPAAPPTSSRASSRRP